MKNIDLDIKELNAAKVAENPNPEFVIINNRPDLDHGFDEAITHLPEIKGAGGGGGCFPAGTKIHTPDGFKAIQDIKVGDQVYAFDIKSLEPGEVEAPGVVVIGKVSGTFVHSFGEVGYTSPLKILKYKPGHVIDEEGNEPIAELVVTGNHYILSDRVSVDPNADQGFCRVDELQEGDLIFTHTGWGAKIEAIADGGEYDFVYNFEVDEYHTYIANNVRVHNGGGGKGNSGRSPVQASNSIRTNQIANVLFLLSEGPIGGPWETFVNGGVPGKSTYFDNTPLINSTGSPNFGDAVTSYDPGNVTKSTNYFGLGLSAIENEVLLNVEVKNVANVVRSVSAAVDAVRVTIEFPNGLQAIDSKTGDANGSSVQLQLYAKKTTGGTYVLIADRTISHMSSGSFQYAISFARPSQSTGPEVGWDFRVDRVTADTTSNFLMNKTFVKEYTEIQYANVDYTNRATARVTVSAESTAGRVPTTSFDVAGVKVQVPDIYSTTITGTAGAYKVTRSASSGTWSGTFNASLQWTNSPVWAIYDLLTHTRYGLGNYIPASMIDKFSFWEASKYADALVDDKKGTGTFENRFSFDAQMMTRENAWQTLQAIASSMNANLYMHNGVIRLSVDMPMTSTKLIGNSNVINGRFVYSTVQVDEIFTACNMTYNDPNDNFLPKTITEPLAGDANYSSGITRYGYNPTELVAYGCTTEGQARRAARWVVDTSLFNQRMVEFDVGIMNADFEPGEVFKLMDNDYSQTQQEGILLSVSGTTLILDNPVTVTSGNTIDLVGSDGATIETRTITTTGTTATITISATTTATVGAFFIITGTVVPQQFKIISLLNSGPGQYHAKAVQYDPNKWARVENGAVLPSPVYFQAPNQNDINSPSTLVVTPQSFVTPENSVIRWLDVTWAAPANGTAVAYQLSWRKDAGYMTVVTGLKTPYARIDVNSGGLFEFYVNALNSKGLASPTLSGSYSLDIGTGTTAPATASLIGPPTGLQLAGGASNWNTNMQIVWTAPTNTSTVGIRDYKVELKPSGGGTAFHTEYVTGTGFSYSYDDNVKDGGVRNSILVNVSTRDTLNRLSSTAAANTFSSVPATAITSIFVRGTSGTTFDTLDLDVTWSATTGGVDYTQDPNFAYFKVEVMSGATVKRTEEVIQAAYTYTFDNNIKDNGQDTPLASIILRITAFNKVNTSGASASATFTPATPPTPTTLEVVNTAGTVFTQNDLEMDWSCISSTKNYETFSVFKYYQIQVFNGVTLLRTNFSQNRTFNYTYEMNSQDGGGTALRTPKVTITAVNVYNIASTAVTVTFSNAAPSAPTISATAGTELVFIDVLRNSADVDVVGYQMHVSTTAGFTPSGTTAGTGTCVYAGPNSAFAYKAVGGTAYFVRAAAYDGFGVTGLNYSAQGSAVPPAPVVSTDYQFTGFTWTPNASGVTNRLGWTAGTAGQTSGTGAGTTWAVAANVVDWTTGTVYVFWDKAAPTVFQTTTNIALATGLDKRIVAEYKGGTNVNSTNGNHLIDASTTIIPNTISAPLLVAGAAVITGTAQIADAILTGAKIVDATIANAKIVDATIATLKLAAGAVTDIKTANTTGNTGAQTTSWVLGSNGADVTFEIMSPNFTIVQPAGFAPNFNFNSTAFVRVSSPRVIWYNTAVSHQPFCYVDWFNPATSAWTQIAGQLGSAIISGPSVNNYYVSTGDMTGEEYQISFVAQAGNTYRIRYHHYINQSVYVGGTPTTSGNSWSIPIAATIITQLK